MQEIVKVQDLLALALHELCNMDARPLGDDGGYLLLSHGVMHHAAGLALLRALLGLGELLLKRRQVRVLEPCGGLVLVAHLRVFNVGVHLFNVGLDLLDLVDAALLALPAGLHLVELILEVCKLLAQLDETILAELVVLLFQRHLLNFELHDLAADIVKLRGHGVYLRAYQRAGFVDKVDGLIWQETVGNVAIRQRCRGDERVIVDAHAVVDLVALLESAEDGYRVLDRRLVYHDRLETALQRSVLLNVLAVLVKRGRTDAVQLAARQHRLEEVARVHAALGLARADYRVQLIDEKDNTALALAYLFEHGLEPLLKLAAVLCARDKRAHVEGEDSLVFQPLGHVAADYTLCQPFGDGRLADARLANQDGVVLRLAGEYADHVSYLGITPDNGVELVFACALHKVGTVFVERIIGALGVIAGDGRGLYLAQLRGESVLRDAVGGKDTLYRRGRRGKDTDHQVLDGHVFIAHRLRGLLGGGDDAACFI